jgi:hypothetical protein
MNFSLVRLFNNLRRGCLQLDNLNKLIFVNKNWSNDFRIDYKTFSSLMELIEVDGELEKELKEFEGTFGNDEILEI